MKTAWVGRLQDAGLYQIGQGQVSPPVIFDVTGLAAGDFNQDGWMDLAIAGNSSVSILLARGDGTFSAPTVYKVCGTAMSAGDLNGDGAPDLVVAACGPCAPSPTCRDGIDVLMNQADGTGRLTVVHTTFSTEMGPQDYQFFPPPQDLDGDCILDLALPGNAAFFLKGLGDGGFAEPVTYPLPGGAGTIAWGMAAGRLRDTGGVDLVTNTSFSNNQNPSDRRDSIRLLLGNGDGTFALGQVLPVAADALAIGDFNGDGIADLAENSLVGPLAIYLGHGDGTFASPVSYFEGGTGSVTLADLDGDGKAEALSANSSYTEATMTVLWHVGDGGVRSTSLPVGNQPPPGVFADYGALFPILAADLDGDGTPEVVVGSADIASGTVNIFSTGCP